MAYLMKCNSCNYTVEWNCDTKTYEKKNKKCPKCKDGKFEQDFSQHGAGFIINGFSAANNYGLKK